jgi:hypothetical protein
VGEGWALRHVLRAIVFQYREHFALRRNPDAGEETYLICYRPA